METYGAPNPPVGLGQDVPPYKCPPGQLVLGLRVPLGHLVLGLRVPLGHRWLLKSGTERNGTERFRLLKYGTHGTEQSRNSHGTVRLVVWLQWH